MSFCDQNHPFGKPIGTREAPPVEGLSWTEAAYHMRIHGSNFHPPAQMRGMRLALLDFDGALVTADALHCRPDTAQAIGDRKGHYLLAIKSNRGRLFAAVKALLDAARKSSRAGPRRTTAHGRSEHRQAVVVAAPRFGQPYGFPDIAAVGRIDSWRANIGEPAKHTARYFLASRPLSEALQNSWCRDSLWPNKGASACR